MLLCPSENNLAYGKDHAAKLPLAKRSRKLLRSVAASDLTKPIVKKGHGHNRFFKNCCTGRYPKDMEVEVDINMHPRQRPLPPLTLAYPQVWLAAGKIQLGVSPDITIIFHSMEQ
jgi:hypothetical protein